MLEAPASPHPLQGPLLQQTGPPLLVITPHVLSKGLRWVIHRVDYESGLLASGDAEDGGSAPVFVEVTLTELGGDGATHHEVVEVTVGGQVI